jgi:hypothetical protein
MSEKLLFVSIWDDGTIRLVDGQLIGKLVDDVSYDELPIYIAEKPELKPIPFSYLQTENDNLKWENQRLQIENHHHRGDCV